MNQLDLIEEMLDDYFYLQRREVDNSNSITPSFYTKEYERIDRQRADAYNALTVIKDRLGINK